MADRLCIDCRYHKVEYFTDNFCLVSAHMCRRGIVVKTSPVDGTKKEAGKMKACEVERAGIFDGSTSRTLCGPTGSFWEGRLINGS